MLFLGMGNFKCVFSTEQEAELVEYIKHMESRLFGLTTTELRCVAFQLAEKNQLQHNFKMENEKAGLDWLKGFLKRHPDLSLRSPEPTSAARAMGFNKVAVGKFFALLTSLVDKFKFRPTRIYNVDETGLTTVPKSHSKVIAMKGRRQVGTLASGERGQLITAALAFSAAGHYVPPFMIFPRVRMKAELLTGAPAETAAACHPSGWMQSTIFVEWLEHFIKHVRPSKEDPVLLLLDGHATHTKNIVLIDLARKHGIILLCFPPHCTHRLQPLDVSFMAPLSTFYSQEVKSWLRNNPGKVVGQYQIAALFGLAYNKAATIQTAVSGFKKTGICPLDENVFSEVDFAPAETTERDEQAINTVPPQFIPQLAISTRPLPIARSCEVNFNELAEISEEESTFNILSVQEATISKIMSSVAKPCDLNKEQKHGEEISTETDLTPSPPRITREITPEKPMPSENVTQCPTFTIKPINFYTKTRGSSFAVSPTDILVVPHGVRKVTNRARGKTAILTESPYKDELQNNIAGKVKSSRIQQVKRKIVIQKQKKKKKIAKHVTGDSSSEEENEKSQDDDTICIYCKEQYSQTTKSDGWLKCTKMCNNWAHEGCTGWPEGDLDDFVCIKCEFVC